MRGLSWLAVVTTPSLPPFCTTSHAQPLPNRSLACVLICERGRCARAMCGGSWGSKQSKWQQACSYSAESSGVIWEGTAQHRLHSQPTPFHTNAHTYAHAQSGTHVPTGTIAHLCHHLLDGTPLLLDGPAQVVGEGRGLGGGALVGRQDAPPQVVVPRAAAVVAHLGMARWVGGWIARRGRLGCGAVRCTGAQVQQVLLRGAWLCSPAVNQSRRHTCACVHPASHRCLNGFGQLAAPHARDQVSERHVAQVLACACVAGACGGQVCVRRELALTQQEQPPGLRRGQPPGRLVSCSAVAGRPSVLGARMNALIRTHLRLPCSACSHRLRGGLPGMPGQGVQHVSTWQGYCRLRTRPTTQTHCRDGRRSPALI